MKIDMIVNGIINLKENCEISKVIGSYYDNAINSLTINIGVYPYNNSLYNFYRYFGVMMIMVMIYAILTKTQLKEWK
jgi:hypothetical protein